MAWISSLALQAHQVQITNGYAMHVGINATALLNRRTKRYHPRPDAAHRPGIGQHLPKQVLAPTLART